MLDIVSLLGINATPDVQAEGTRFYCHIPHAAPYAYLHTIFAPVSSELLASTSALHDIPEIWASFLQTQNGANVYFGSLHFYGLVAPGQLFNRENMYARLPFSLTDANRRSVMRGFPDWLMIGSYGFNASRLLLHRVNGSLQAINEPGDTILAEWPNLATFFSSEISRLTILFSDSGRLLVDEKFTVPSGHSVPYSGDVV